MTDTNRTTDQQLPDHTFGPWWVDDRREAGGALQVQAKHRGEGSSYCVATVNHWDQPNANARLIAAAPDLLAIAKHIAAILNHPTQGVSVLDCEKLEAAIAKAEGRS